MSIALQGARTTKYGSIWKPQKQYRYHGIGGSAGCMMADWSRALDVSR